MNRFCRVTLVGFPYVNPTYYASTHPIEELQEAIGKRNEEYQVCQFTGSDRIKSPTFPELNLTAEQIFQAQR